jgi:hypothetical protein
MSERLRNRSRRCFCINVTKIGYSKYVSFWITLFLTHQNKSFEKQRFPETLENRSNILLYFYKSDRIKTFLSARNFETELTYR